MHEIYPAFSPGPTQRQLWDFAIKIKTATPGLGLLLVTLRYNDGEGDQDLNVSLNLLVPGYAVATWPNLWLDNAFGISMGYTFLVPGGTADVECLFRGNGAQ